MWSPTDSTLSPRSLPGEADGNRTRLGASAPTPVLKTGGPPGALTPPKRAYRRTMSIRPTKEPARRDSLSHLPVVHGGPDHAAPIRAVRCARSGRGVVDLPAARATARPRRRGALAPGLVDRPRRDRRGGARVRREQPPAVHR